MDLPKNLTTQSYSSYQHYSNWERLINSIDNTKFYTRYPGNLYASTSFMIPYPSIIDYEILILAFIQLIEQYAYNIDSEYVKLNIGYRMLLPTYHEISLTLGKAIPLCDPLGNRLQKKMIYDIIEQQVRLYGEKYQDALITGVFINIYYESKGSQQSFDFPNIYDSNLIGKIIKVMDSDIINANLPEVKSLKYKQSRIPSKITAIKSSNIQKRRSFIVADIETVMVNDVHVPYAAGYLVVNPGDDLTSIPSYSIQTFFSENHITFYPNFEERSQRMLFEYFSHLEECVKKNRGLRTIYFHNLARFDGIFILRYYADRGKKYKIKPLVRNHKIYELKVYIELTIIYSYVLEIL